MNGTILKEIDARRARRAYDERPVGSDVVDRILAAATLAPSCSNKQPWRFVVVDREPGLGRVRESLQPGNYWAKKAPLYVLAVTDISLNCMLDDDRNYALFDTGLAVMNLMLQATAEGLYAHPIAGFQPVPMKEAFGIPAGHSLIAVVVLGYPGDETGLNEKHRAAEHEGRMRKAISEVVFRGGWPAGNG